MKALFALFIAVLLCVAMCSCTSSSMQRAQRTIATVDAATHVVDGVLRARYAAVSASGDVDSIRRFNRAVESMYLTHAALENAASLLDVVEGDARIGQVMACVAESVLVLVERLQELGVEMPEALAALLGGIGEYASGVCDPTDHVDLTGVPEAVR
jgi:hypothetical protein